VDRTPKPHPRGCQTWEANVRVDPLAAWPGGMALRPSVTTTWLRGETAVFDERNICLEPSARPVRSIQHKIFRNIFAISRNERLPDRVRTICKRVRPRKAPGAKPGPGMDEACSEEAWDACSASGVNRRTPYSSHWPCCMGS
jgi:hypothetical protein